MLKLQSLVCLFLFISLELSAQGGSAVPFLTFCPSPSVNGMGTAGVALPQDDANLISFNPALAGLNSNTRNLAISYSPLNWNFNNNFSHEMDNFGILVGFDAKNLFGIPLNIGAGYLRQYFDLGVFRTISEKGDTSPPFQSYETSDNFTIAGSIDCWAKLGFGFTVKHIFSSLAPATPPYDSNDGKTWAMDFGLIASLPALNNMEILDKVKLDLDFNIGYSLQNLFGDIQYRNETDPLPRMDRLGYSVNTRFKYGLDKEEIIILGADWSVETNDMLFKRDSLGYSYITPLSGINIWNNTIALKNSSTINLCFGWRVSLFEIFSLSGGKISERNIYEFKTNGFEISSRGITKLFGNMFDSEAVAYINKHIEIRYINSKNEITNQINKYSFDYWGVNLIIRNFDIF